MLPKEYDWLYMLVPSGTKTIQLPELVKSKVWDAVFNACYGNDVDWHVFFNDRNNVTFTRYADENDILYKLPLAEVIGFLNNLQLKELEGKFGDSGKQDIMQMFKDVSSKQYPSALLSNGKLVQLEDSLNKKKYYELPDDYDWRNYIYDPSYFLLSDKLDDTVESIYSDVIKKNNMSEYDLVNTDQTLFTKRGERKKELFRLDNEELISFMNNIMLHYLNGEYDEDKVREEISVVMKKIKNEEYPFNDNLIALEDSLLEGLGNDELIYSILDDVLADNNLDMYTDFSPNEGFVLYIVKKQTQGPSQEVKKGYIPLDTYYEMLNSIDNHLNKDKIYDKDMAYSDIEYTILDKIGEAPRVKGATMEKSENCLTENEFGTIEYERNEGKQNRIKRFKEMIQLEESANITEGDIQNWAFSLLCMEENIDPKRLKSELLGEI